MKFIEFWGSLDEAMRLTPHPFTLQSYLLLCQGFGKCFTFCSFLLETESERTAWSLQWVGTACHAEFPLAFCMLYGPWFNVFLCLPITCPSSPPKKPTTTAKSKTECEEKKWSWAVLCSMNQNTQEVQKEFKKERFLIWTGQNNVQIFCKCCLQQSDKRTNRYKTQNVGNT